MVTAVHACICLYIHQNNKILSLYSYKVTVVVLGVIHFVACCVGQQSVLRESRHGEARRSVENRHGPWRHNSNDQWPTATHGSHKTVVYVHILLLQYVCFQQTLPKGYVLKQIRSSLYSKNLTSVEHKLLIYIKKKPREFNNVVVDVLCLVLRCWTDLLQLDSGCEDPC